MFLIGWVNYYIPYIIGSHEKRSLYYQPIHAFLDVYVVQMVMLFSGKGNMHSFESNRSEIIYRIIRKTPLAELFSEKFTEKSLLK